MIIYIADTFTEIESEGDNSHDPEQHYLQPVSLDQALQALDVVLRYEEELDAPNSQLQALLRRRVREENQKKLQNLMDQARQQSLYSYFLSK